MSEGKEKELYIGAQQRLVSSLLAESDSITRVLELITEEDIEEPTLAIIFSNMAELSRLNEPISAITVSERLENAGDLLKVGGVSGLYRMVTEGKRYLVDAPAEVYARIVKESSAKAKISRIITEAIPQFKDGSGVQAADAVSLLQSDLNENLLALSDSSTISRMNDDFDEYLNLLDERKRISEENEGNAEGLQGIPSLLPSINKYTTGWLPGQLITVGAGTGRGKALALDTPILTTAGWSTMGELKVGDKVFGRDGRPTTVVNATEIQYDRECFEVILHNGDRIIADADHRWLTETHQDRKGRGEGEAVRTTLEIRDSLRVLKDERLNHSIIVTDPVIFNDDEEVELPIDPYVFGYWLGDGHSYSTSLSIHKDDSKNMIDYLSSIGYYYTVNDSGDCYDVRFSKHPIKRGGDMSKYRGSRTDLRELGVLQNKHIPELYKKASVRQRKLLLAGLVDSDGTVDKSTGKVFFGVTRKVLADDAAELASSLGLVILRNEKRVKGRSEETSTAYTIAFKSPFNPFRLERKAMWWRPRGKRHERVYIKAVNPVPSVPVRCIQVDNEDHVYLAGRRMLPTHNTVYAVNCAVAAAMANKSVMFFSLEMGKTELQDRILASTTAIPMNKLKQGRLTEEEREVLKKQMEEMKSMSLVFDVEPKQTIDSIRARALRQAQSPAGLDFIVVDYLQLVTPTGRFSSRQEAVADMSRNMKLLAKQLNVPIMILVQLKRKDESDESSIPKLEEIRESGAIAQDSDVVILLHRDQATDNNIPHTLVILAKNRNGEADKIVRCHSNLECSLFREVTRVKDIEDSLDVQDSSFMGGDAFTADDVNGDFDLDDDFSDFDDLDLGL